MARNRTRNRNITVTKQNEAVTSVEKNIEEEYMDMMKNMSIEDMEEAQQEEPVINKEDKVTEIIDETISTEEKEEVVEQEEETVKEVAEPIETVEEAKAEKVESVVEEEKKVEETKKQEESVVKEDKKEPKKRKTMREMFGYDWLGVNYDY